MRRSRRALRCRAPHDERPRSVHWVGCRTRFAFDNGDWESGEYSGLVALKPTRDATLAASNSGSAWTRQALSAAEWEAAAQRGAAHTMPSAMRRLGELG
jgi:hypothetical protein